MKTTINIDKIQIGDLMAFTQYVRVSDKFGSSNIRVLNVAGGPHFDINGPELVSSMSSADRFGETIKVSKTRAAEILTTSTHIPFTVAFVKTDGSQRILRGRLIEADNFLGRSMCEDLDIPFTEKNRIRLVDHRTLEYLIVDGVKYEVK